MNVHKISIKSRHILILAMAPLALSCSTSLRPTPRESACIFDHWLPDENRQKFTMTVAQWPSPSGRFMVSCLQADEDLGQFILVGREEATGKTTTLGYDDRGVDVRWYKTRVGEIVIVKNWIDNGTEELYVVGSPHVAGDNWSLLYKTPDSFGKLVVAHCYWEIVDLDGDLGTLKLSASWDFSNVTNSERQQFTTEGVYTVPIFYGAK